MKLKKKYRNQNVGTWRKKPVSITRSKYKTFTSASESRCKYALVIDSNPAARHERLGLL